MKNFVQRGRSVYVPCPSTVAGSAAVSGCKSGDIVAVKNLVGIAGADSVAAATVAIHVVGIFTIPKITGAIAIGDLIYYDPQLGKVGTGAGASSGFLKIGICTKAALSADTTVEVRLNGGY